MVNANTKFDGLLKPAAVASQLGYDLSNVTERVSFWRACRKWRIPYYRIGARTIRFREDDLSAWIESKRVGRVPSIQSQERLDLIAGHTSNP